MPATLQHIGEKIHQQGIFTGGPVEFFDQAGRLQLYTLVREGLSPYSKILDVGCGCLRSGYWLVRLLDPGCYFGIEPNQPMLQAGIEHCLTPELLALKRPRFDSNDRFDFSVFETTFDVVVARSIWSHTSKEQIQVMLDHFVERTNPDAFFLASYLPSAWYSRRRRDYRGKKWIGKSHQCEAPGLVHHSKSWIAHQCSVRKLHLRELSDAPFNGQRWLKITKNS
ncbi:MAG: class I SAM-dependent methyltransferase [Terriglobales bacterium]|jgi:SAM-dependent methyltransferase|nr:class I SAM-dependent methyltransferase [Terriglobales bacterium]